MILEVARTIDLPNWYVGAGLIRATVWDYLHGYPVASEIPDIDVAYCSKERLEENELPKFTKLAPEFKWDLRNAATLHVWYKRDLGIEIEPMTSAEQDIASWPEYASCIGLRLLGEEETKLYAPYGIEDLMEMKWRRNADNPQITREVTEKRLIKKRILERWPSVKADGM